MRLLNFLNEENVGIDDIIKNCWEYIQFRKKYNCRFVRGLLGYTNKDKIYRNVLSDRKPKGTNKELFIFINSWLKKNNMVERNKSIPITTNVEIAKKFGLVYECFPVGKFDYTFCKSIDFNQNNENDPFQIAYFAWLYLKENNKSHIWHEYVSNIDELIYYSNFLNSIKKDEKKYIKYKELVDFYSEKPRTLEELDKTNFSIDNNYLEDFYYGYEFNNLDPMFRINEFPSDLIINFEFPVFFDSYALPGENIKSNNIILSKKLKFTIKELETGSKNLKSLIKTNNGIKEVISNNYEIWINPKEFYLVPEHKIKEVLTF